MDFMSIAEAIENGEMVLTATELINLSVMAVTKDEHINCDALAEVIKGLQGVKKTAMEDFKSMQKELENENKEVLAQRGKAWFATLKVGDPITWHDTKSMTVIEGTVGETKKGAVRAHCILNEIPAGSKAQNPRADRYVPYNQLFVPADFVVEAVA